jgi:menaquinone-dependent protoporphyrinogen oxidase
MGSILVAYASKSGSTAEIAAWIAEALSRAGATAEVRTIGEITGLDGFDAVVVGGALYVGRVNRAVPRFFRRYHKDLQNRPVALFISGSSLGEDRKPEDEEKARDVAESARNGIPLAATAFFGGRFSPKGIPLVGRFMKETDEQDNRDRAGIEAWAEALPHRFGL